MVRIDNSVVLYTPYGEVEREIGNIEDAEVFEGYMSLGGHGIPLERFSEIQTAWQALYPNGKPQTIVRDSTSMSSHDRRTKSSRNNDIPRAIRRILTAVGITPTTEKSQPEPPK